MRLLAIIFIVFISTLSYSQGRDSTVTRTLRYISSDLGEGLVDTQTEWSDSLSNYLVYSRINMGNRMNRGIEFNNKARKQLTTSVVLGACAGGMLLWQSYADPVVYVEYHSKYTRDYYNKAQRYRDARLITAGVFGAGALYMLWKSNKTYKRSRWHISPNGVKYRF